MSGFGQAGTFKGLATPPVGAGGQRGYTTVDAARAAALAAHAPTFVLIQQGQEFAWITPAKAYHDRMGHALQAGIKLIEMGKME